MGNPSSPRKPDRVILVPGFMSPRWMLYPLFRYLRSQHPHVTDWDYPRVFRKLQTTVHSLAELLQNETRAGHCVGLVSHSFGDWVARSALAVAGDVSVTKFASISPVAAAVPMARWLHRLTGNLIPEICVMSDDEQAGIARDVPPRVDHVVFWAAWDFVVKRPEDWSNPTTRHETIKGTHNSLVFQPRLWRRVAEHLR